MNEKNFMGKGRLEAFSDGVLAIIITIMVLELKVPHGSALEDLKPLLPTFLCYALSFIYIGIYWHNHHHLLQVTKHINGRTLWANSHLLFWLSLIPFTTSWMGENHFANWPVALYGINLLLAGLAYYILAQVLVSHHGKESLLGQAIGGDFKGKTSVVVYAVAFPLSFYNVWIACSLYVLVAIMWLIPDKRIEKIMFKNQE